MLVAIISGVVGGVLLVMVVAVGVICFVRKRMDPAPPDTTNNKEVELE